MPQIVIDLTDTEYKALEATFDNVEKAFSHTVQSALKATMEDFKAVVLDHCYAEKLALPKDDAELVTFAYANGLVMTIADRNKKEAEDKAKADAEFEAEMKQSLGQTFEPNAADTAQNDEFIPPVPEVA